MYDFILEIAVFTFEGVINATNAGADRIELCENPHDGGTTPSYGMLRQVKSNISIPVFPIIRPRGGDFVYNDYEFEVIKEDIRCCKDIGFEGIVCGLLKANGDIDLDKTTALVEIASPMQVTFHRAFDRTKEPIKALEDVIKCGCTRILTSGQHPNVMHGLKLIKELVERARDRIIIMPGSGLNSKHIQEIASITKAKEFHTAARKIYSNMEYFSPDTMNEKLAYTTVDEEEVKSIRRLLQEME